MKKIILICLTLMLVISITACGTKQNAVTASEPETELEKSSNVDSETIEEDNSDISTADKSENETVADEVVPSVISDSKSAEQSLSDIPDISVNITACFEGDDITAEFEKLGIDRGEVTSEYRYEFVISEAQQAELLTYIKESFLQIMESGYPDCSVELSDDFTEVRIYCTPDLYESDASGKIAFGYCIYLDAYTGISGEDSDNTDFTLSFFNSEDNLLIQTFNEENIFS